MLAHLPGRMSQPSRKGVTSNIFILRCSFHKTAKRLSITSLTHLLRLHTKIQSSIVRHDKMSVLVIPVILLQTKRKRNTKYHKPSTTKTKLSNSTTKFPPSYGDTKITDWITSQKPICQRHPINLNNNITDISQKKDLPKSANDTIIYRLSLWYKQWKVEVAYSKMQHDSTLDALKLLNDIQNSHPMSQSCFLKGKKHKMLQSKS